MRNLPCDPVGSPTAWWTEKCSHLFLLYLWHLYALNIQRWKRNRKVAIKNPHLKKLLVHCNCEINGAGSEFQKPPDPAVKELPWLDRFCSLGGSFLFVVLFWPHVWSPGKFSLFPHLPCHLPKQTLGELGHIRPLNSFLGFLSAGAVLRNQGFLHISHSWKPLKARLVTFQLSEEARSLCERSSLKNVF